MESRTVPQIRTKYVFYNILGPYALVADINNMKNLPSFSNEKFIGFSRGVDTGSGIH